MLNGVLFRDETFGSLCSEKRQAENTAHRETNGLTSGIRDDSKLSKI